MSVESWGSGPRPGEPSASPVLGAKTPGPFLCLVAVRQCIRLALRDAPDTALCSQAPQSPLKREQASKKDKVFDDDRCLY